MSFYPHTVEVIYEILSCPTLKQVLFPAKLYIQSDVSIELSAPSDFHISQVPREFSNESLSSIALLGNNGVEFFSRIYLIESSTPHVFGLKFTSEHLQTKQICFESLKTLFTEAIPGFQAHYGAVYGRHLDRQRYSASKIRYYVEENYKSYPLRIGWMTYFGKPMLEFLTLERFMELHTCSEKYELYNGIMVILQAEPYDESNPDHRSRQAQAG
jgi:hypothetical protein